MSKNQRTELAARALAGLTANQPMTAHALRGAKHEINSCGQPMGCALPEGP